ncbi:MAG: zinc ABC transporter substrate-binding protein [Planctomycetaceae bacterium]|nr:zinc ABC transporter substrate-binding protein [Planctomycetaceae bacterium]
MKPTLASYKFLAIPALLLLASCGGSTSERRDEARVPVFAGIPPVAYLVEQIGGKHVAVDVLVQPGQDPHTFEPTPRQAMAIARAKLFFEIGMPFEVALLQKIREGNPQLTLVDVGKGIKKRMIEGCGHGHHAEGGEPDPHVWLSPAYLKIAAKNIAAGLSAADPIHAADYQRHLDSLVAKIEATHRQIATMLAPYRGRSFLVFHPGFGYFADAYGLKEEAVEEGGRPPAPKQLRALIEKAKAEGIKAVFVQPEFDPHSAEVVAKEIGGRVVLINGLGGDVLRDLVDIATKIEKSFQAETPRRHGDSNTEGLAPRREGARNGLKEGLRNQSASRLSLSSFSPSLSSSPTPLCVREAPSFLSASPSCFTSGVRCGQS